MTKNKEKTGLSENQKLAINQRILSDISDRLDLSRQMGWQYGDERKVYDALGYPADQKLVFQYYWKRYVRQDIAAAVIDRPVDGTWKGDIIIVEPDKKREDSELAKAWKSLDREFNVKQTLNKLDKLTGIGKFGILLFGLDDVNSKDDWKTPTTGTRKLNYIRPVAEHDVYIQEFEKHSANPRFGLPKFYKITTSSPETDGSGTYDIIVHWSRLLHIVDNNLTGQVVGQPRLKPIINRLNDLEKLMGGSAEMFWRGARPGYHIKLADDFDMTDDTRDDLDDELKAYENDVRRFLVGKGMEITPLEMQVANPEKHVDIQLQAISAYTRIPKRILTGSERGELASSQDADAWKEVLQTRREEFAEPNILRLFVDYCMNLNILPSHEDYNVLWSDLFALSEKDRVEIGKLRADAIAAYGNSLQAQELVPPETAYRILLGLEDDELEEFLNNMKESLAKMRLTADGRPDDEPIEE